MGNATCVRVRRRRRRYRTGRLADHSAQAAFAVMMCRVNRAFRGSVIALIIAIIAVMTAAMPRTAAAPWRPVRSREPQRRWAEQGRR